MIGTLSNEEIELILHRSRGGRVKMPRGSVIPVMLDYDGYSLLCWNEPGVTSTFDEVQHAAIQIVEKRASDMRHIVVASGTAHRVDSSHERVSAVDRANSPRLP